MGQISTVEDAMIAKCRSALLVNNKSLVRTIDVIPGPWSADLLRRMLQLAPGVYIAFISAKPMSGDAELNVTGRFDVAAVTSHAGNETARRRGDKTQIGAYEIMERIVPHLHQLTVPGIGSLRCVGVSNLFTQATFDLGATVYTAQFTIPMNLPLITDGSDLDDFELFHVDYDIPVFENSETQQKWAGENYGDEEDIVPPPDAQDDIQLEQDES